MSNLLDKVKDVFNKGKDATDDLVEKAKDGIEDLKDKYEESDLDEKVDKAKEAISNTMGEGSNVSLNDTLAERLKKLK